MSGNNSTHYNYRGAWRGKRLDNGKWVIGDLIRYESGETSILYERFSRHGYEATEIIRRVLVNSATLGECTGLRDKSGKLIFEGDIVYFYTGYRYLVVWSKEHAAFMCQNLKRGTLSYNISIISSDCEIVGNAYDNFTLLKGVNTNGE